jgi:hypothetical protein
VTNAALRIGQQLVGGFGRQDEFTAPGGSSSVLSSSLQMVFMLGRNTTPCCLWRVTCVKVTAREAAHETHKDTDNLSR